MRKWKPDASKEFKNSGPNGRPTIIDVGKAAGVSQTAVSYVLSGSPYADRLKPETREKILETARRLGYSRNSAGAALKRGYSNNIVLLAVTWELAIAYANTIVALTRAAAERGLNMNVQVAADDAEAAHLLETIPSLSPYGLIVIWDSESIPEEMFLQLRQGGMPIVDLLPPKIGGVASVTADREQGWYIATKYLIDLGHRRIGYITNTAFRSRTSNVKLRGYKRALEEGGMEFSPELVEEVISCSLEEGYDSLPRLLSRCPDLTAVVCINDTIALGAVACARDKEIAVPERLSVISGGASKEGAFFRPRLTNIIVPDESTIFPQEALDIIVKMRNDMEWIPETIYKSMGLVIRESTALAPR